MSRAVELLLHLRVIGEVTELQVGLQSSGDYFYPGAEVLNFLPSPLCSTIFDRHPHNSQNFGLLPLKFSQLFRSSPLILTAISAPL